MATTGAGAWDCVTDVESAAGAEEATAAAGAVACGCVAGVVTLACCDTGLDDAVEAGVVLAGAVLDGALEGGVALEVMRSSRLGGWTALVVIIAPPANPIEIAATTVPTPAK